MSKDKESSQSFRSRSSASPSSIAELSAIGHFQDGTVWKNTRGSIRYLYNALQSCELTTVAERRSILYISWSWLELSAKKLSSTFWLEIPCSSYFDILHRQNSDLYTQQNPRKFNWYMLKCIKMNNHTDWNLQRK